jgi:cysteine desulfurase
MKRVYLDFAATTPIDSRVSKEMRDFELKYYGNPSSIHREGQSARAKIDFAREVIAKFINAKPQEIIFTSGATEANNLAIQGTVNRAILSGNSKPHVVTTLLEHQSVYNVVKELEKRGLIEATYIKPSKDGQIKASDVLKALQPNTVLVSIIFVSNEIGTILPIREIGKALAESKPGTRSPKPVFHVDAVQAAKFYNLNVEKLNCNLLTLSAHKLYGPKGIGALYIKSGTKLSNLIFGGSQEYGKRPGTQNTAGIIGFAKAVELLGSLEEREKFRKKLAKLRDQLIMGLQTIRNAELNGPAGDSRTADNANFTFYNVDQDALMTALDLAGIAASTGSACVSGSTEPSYVIESLGKISDRASATARFTLGKNTTVKDIKYVIMTVKEILTKLRNENEK